MRARDHHPARTLLAIVGTLPASLLTGPLAARWTPGDDGWAFALGWHLPYVVWPMAIVATLLAPSWRHAAFALVVSTGVLALLVVW